MFKAGDKVLVVRLESKVRPTTIHEQANAPDLGSFITEKPKETRTKGVIGTLHAFYLGVKLASGKIRYALYADLTFLKGGKASFKTRLPSWKGIDPKTHKETIKPGKLVTIKGKVILQGVHIPVLIDGEPCQIPYENLVFKETK